MTFKFTDDTCIEGDVVAKAMNVLIVKTADSFVMVNRNTLASDNQYALTPEE